MTNQASVQAQIWKGYCKAAEKLGANFAFYRPATWTESAWGSGSFLGTSTSTRPVSLNAEDMKYGKPKKYAKATWYALVDGTELEVGDYFVGPQGTFFIAALQPLLPILAVECNRTISIARVPPQTAAGAQSYSGMTAQSEVPVVTGVPCSILQGTKGEKSETQLPGDTRSPWWAILLPNRGLVMLGDLIIDDLGQRYVVSGPEQTALGWRLTAMMAMA
jgi:hypothetical protein